MTNHLAGSSSPYLLQHAGNPVNWYLWGAEALEKARREDKPIFLSIGYAACHWCHVMAHESFEDTATAELMNAHFVNIKVDREERPDLDSIYMSYVVAISGHGGWPMSVFLTPDGKPFYGGTYFPPTRRHGMPAFSEVLQAVARLWRQDRQQLLKDVDQVIRSLQPAPASMPGSRELDHQLMQTAVSTLALSYDWQEGGWGGAPKFPQPMLVEFLLRQASRGDQPALNMATHVLRAMARGGMYDLLGGGFARYSVESTWLIPHFEKMLYDNAQLALVYLHAHLQTGEPEYREVCQSTLDFILREMTHPEGGFYSSLDADSDGVEGKFYAWSAEEVHQVLDSDQEAELFMAAYGVTDQGNFEGLNVLRRTLNDEQLAEQLGLETDAIPGMLDGLRHRLMQVRSQRVRPATDDKVLVSWNALALIAFAEAGRALERSDYTQAAQRCAGFILGNMLEQGRLKRSWREGKASHDAYLEDHAALGLALLSLYQADGNPHWYQSALSQLEEILDHFTAPDAGFYDTRDDHEDLIYRPRDLQDNATPSGNALAAMLLLQLATYEGRSDWRDQAEQMISANRTMMERYPSAFGQWLNAADFALGPVHEVAILGEMDDPVMQGLLQPVWKTYRPRLVMAASAYPPPPGSPALLHDRPLLHGKPTVYVCQGFVCQQPVNDLQAMLSQLGTG